jgi:hypothetical protein
MPIESQSRTGRRDGRTIERVCVAVSPEMAKLRRQQQELNYFLYSTELSYGMPLTSNDPRLANREALVSDALANVYASAWYPSNQGEIKYRVKIATFLEHLESNARRVSRAVITQWLSQFEEYLETRVRPIIEPRQEESAQKELRPKNWGPLTRTLCHDRLLYAPTPIRISTVLRADFCREIRNRIVHGSADLPDSCDNPDVDRWRRRRIEDLEGGSWTENDTRTNGARERLVMDALHYVLGQAINHRNATRREGRRENLEHFYTLFSFTNLDSLAVEIEEALLPMSALPEGRIWRKATAVQRTDLIVRESAATVGD